jgi:hypothetical protein
MKTDMQKDAHTHEHNHAQLAKDENRLHCLSFISCSFSDVVPNILVDENVSWKLHQTVSGFRQLNKAGLLQSAWSDKVIFVIEKSLAGPCVVDCLNASMEWS